jgi:PAS domain S-box-containing protein
MEQTLRELTEKLIESENALKLSEAQFATAFKLSPYAITITTKEGRFIKTNDAFYEMSGFSTENREDTSLGLWVDPTEREKVITELFKVGKVLLKEVKFKRKDGTVLDSLFSAQLMIVCVENQEEYILSIISDVTEQKQVSEALRMSEEKYKMLVENLNEGIWLIDANSITTYVNDIIAGMLGYTKEEMLGKSLFLFMDEEGIKEATKNVERRKQGIKEHHEFSFVKKDGSKSDFYLNTSPIIVNGEYKGSVAAITNNDLQVKTTEVKVKDK